MTWICLNMLHILRVTLLVIHRLSWQLHCIQWMLQFPWMLYLTILSVKQYVHPYLLNFRLQKVSVYWVEALNSLHFQTDNTHIIVKTFLRQSVNRQVSALIVQQCRSHWLTSMSVSPVKQSAGKKNSCSCAYVTPPLTAARSARWHGYIFFQMRRGGVAF